MCTLTAPIMSSARTSSGRSRKCDAETAEHTSASTVAHPLGQSPCYRATLCEGDEDEEHQHDLADDPGMGVHPVARLGKERPPPVAEHEQNQRRQRQKQQREQQEGKEVPPWSAVTRQIGTDGDRGEDVGWEHPQEKEAKPERESRARRLQLAHPFR